MDDYMGTVVFTGEHMGVPCRQVGLICTHRGTFTYYLSKRCPQFNRGCFLCVHKEDNAWAQEQTYLQHK